MDDLLAAQQHATKNRAEIEASQVCGCFYCMQTFLPTDIVAWTGLDMNSLAEPGDADADTALCPKCGSESVLGDRSGFPVTPQFLGQMNEAWFQRTIIHRPKGKK